MIPLFPTFKKLELSDKRDVEAHTRRFPPYSDFNFISMWSWDTTGRVLVSELNGNLAVRFTDYATAEPFYMFLGTNDYTHTAAILIDRAACEGISRTLSLIPECVAEHLDTTSLRVVERAEHSDYLFSTDDWSRYEGPRLSDKRKIVQRFRENNPAAICIQIDSGTAQTQDAMQKLFSEWFARKHPEGLLEEEHEYIAFRRSVEHLHAWFIATGVFIHDRLIGFILCEDSGNSIAVGHFSKADTHNYPGVFEFLHQESAKIWHAQGIRYLNHEQDLGLPGLRQSKRSYAPVSFLKKYAVSRDADRP